MFEVHQLQVCIHKVKILDSDTFLYMIESWHNFFGSWRPYRRCDSGSAKLLLESAEDWIEDVSGTATNCFLAQKIFFVGPIVWCEA